MMKLFNYRPMLFVFIMLSFGSIVGISCVSSPFYLFLLFIPVVIIVLSIFYKKDMLIKHIVSIVMAISLMFVGLSSVLSIGAIIEKPLFTNNQTYMVSATIENVSSNKGTYILLNNVSISSGDKAIKLPYKSSVYFSSFSSEVSRGDKIIFIAKLRTTASSKNYNFNKTPNEYAKCYAQEEDIIELQSGKSLDYLLRRQIKDRIFSNMSSEIAGVSYAMLVGDKSSLDPQAKESFKESGISHLLAVSGLHVGFLVLILNFLTNKIRMSRWLKLSIISFVLFIYAWICGFSPSIVRAGFMSVVLLFASACGKQYDGLSALSFAGIILLIINPLNILNIGFLLSFSAVFGIMLLYQPIKLLFSKIFYNWLSSSLAMSMSATIGTLPFTLYFFGTFPVLSIITNIFAIPIASIAFMSLFVITIITLILPFMGFLMKVPEILFYLLVRLSVVVSSTGVGNINKQMNAICFIPYTGAMISASNYFLVKTKTKIISISIFLLILLLLFIII
ncbi:MAG: ComEC/Rec2 family competence protein [Clostridia bacterium]